ncbi:hypothetical protein C2E23DRAFT_464306 [Lenzites betulinus]|nr:hypothetical protein C2E23DRAFT_464306 [Lenzites betulinus]
MAGTWLQRSRRRGRAVRACDSDVRLIHPSINSFWSHRHRCYPPPSSLISPTNPVTLMQSEPPIYVRQCSNSLCYHNAASNRCPPPHHRDAALSRPSQPPALFLALGTRLPRIPALLSSSPRARGRLRCRPPPCSDAGRCLSLSPAPARPCSLLFFFSGPCCFTLPCWDSRMQLQWIL